MLPLVPLFCQAIVAIFDDLALPGYSLPSAGTLLNLNHFRFEVVIGILT